MLHFIAAEVVKESKPLSKLCVLLFRSRDLVNNCEKGHFLFFEVFQSSQVVFCWYFIPEISICLVHVILS